MSEISDVVQHSVMIMHNNNVQYFIHEVLD